jgi:hypothetical protein
MPQTHRITLSLAMLLTICCTTIGCSESVDVPEMEVTTSDRLETLEVLRGPESLPLAVEPEPPIELTDDPVARVARFSQSLADLDLERRTLDGLFEVAQEQTPLSLHLELPMWGKEFHMLSTSVDSLEALLSCLNRDAIEPGSLCEEDELLAALAQFRGTTASAPRHCGGGCCLFGYDRAPEGTLLVRRLCYDEIDDQGRMGVTDLTLGFD